MGLDPRPVRASPTFSSFSLAPIRAARENSSDLFESICISENIADFRPALSFLFDVFVDTFVTAGEGEKANFTSIFDQIARTVTFPIGFVHAATLAFTILSPPPLSPLSAFPGLVWLRFASPAPFSRRFLVCSKILYNHGDV